MKDTLEVIASRSSIRSYQDEPICEKCLETIINALLQAPTARNAQELHVSVVKKGHPVLEELQNDLNPDAKVSWYYNAAVVLFISGDNDFKWTALDAGIAVENGHLAAASLGLGSIVLGCIDGVMSGEKKTHYNEVLGIPENYTFKIALAVGNPDTTKEPHKYDVEKQVTYVK